MGKRLLVIFSGIILIATLAAGAAYYYLFRLPLPKANGNLHLKGLTASVKVIRDRWGIPHIYAANEYDLFMAQGYVHAQDRLWQMEANRRLAAGRLSEIFGPQTVELDRFLRTFGFMRAARREVATFDAEAIEIARAYCAGVNAFIDRHADRLPVEFRLLSFSPEPWTPEASIALGKVMAFMGSKNWQEEIVRAMLIQTLGKEKAQHLLELDRPAAPPTIPPDVQFGKLLPHVGPLQSKTAPYLGGASNNWTVHGSRSHTGLPILANDMHLPVKIPSMWYEIHLSGGNFDVIGLSIAGIPMIVAGHNANLAWGVTFAYLDNQDLYLEKFHPEKKGVYRYRDQWVKAEPVKEPIRIKGREEPEDHTVWITRHGPILSPQPAASKSLGYALSLKWSAFEPGNMFSGLYRINRSHNWEEFLAAAREWSEPPLNLVYADSKGNIGYVLAGRIPIRAQGHGRGPFTGWTGENEWVGTVPADRKPFLFNPAGGYIATANNRIAGDSFPYYLSEDTAPGYRAARIRNVLSANEFFTVEDSRELQNDLLSPPAETFLESLSREKGRTPETADLLNRLRSWDRRMGSDSTGAAIYAVLYYRMMENTFSDDLGPLTERFFGVGWTPVEPLNSFAMHSRNIFLGLMSDPESFWFDNTRTPEREQMPDVLEKSLAETRVFLERKFGPDPKSWRWGILHDVVFRHPLGQVSPLDRLFNLGPYEGSGHFSTVLQSAVTPGMDFGLHGWAVSNRHIYDTADWDRSLGSIVPGQSGMVGSPHYDDQVRLWRDGKLHPLYYSRAKIESESKTILILHP